MNQIFIHPNKIILLIFSLLILLVSCQPADIDPILSTDLPAPVCSKSDISEVNEVFIGATAPFSKPGAASEGVAMMAAFQIAQKDINEAGGVLGKNIRVIVDDTAGLPERGREISERLIKESCVVGIVGEYHSDVGLAIMEVAHQNHIPTIFTETYSEDITSSGYPEIFRIAPPTSFTAQVDAKWLAAVGDYNQDGALFAVVIAEDTNFGVNQIESSELWFPEYGIEIKSLETDFSNDDFSSVIAIIKEYHQRPDAIFIKVTGQSSFILLQQLLDADLGPRNQTIIAANQVALNHAEYWEHIPEGDFIVVPRIGPWPPMINKIGLDFAQKYQEIFEKWPEAYAFEAYDSLWIMADAINRAGSIDPDAIIDALEKTDIELASGRYYFPFGKDNPPTDYIPAYMWHQWPDVPIFYLQYTEINQLPQDMDVLWPPAYQTADQPIIRPSR
ncbi:MAG: ABC transporter substrate-binding protein [Chloroflexota bacterium]